MSLADTPGSDPDVRTRGDPPNGEALALSDDVLASLDELIPARVKGA